MDAEISRFIWRALRSRFRDHRAELAAIRGHIRPGGVVCDVGANKGSFLLWLSRWCEAGKVVAFEPQPELAAYLARMCSALKLQNVIVEERAAFSETGERELFIPNGHQPGASLKAGGLSYATLHTITVPTVALDDYFPERDFVSVLKIDVEGAETDVFRGADRILRRDKPLLVFECEARHLGESNISDVFRRLEKIGYHGSFVRRGKTFPVSQFREETHQRREGEWFWKSAGYCSNFVFSAR
ncbi:FkbM family methyltransferase [Bradyrhizobium japonicum]|uniref:FkbM family methyltransferase n=1 Tax=Bradyrhizobium japonicum TaxID=375 RepID=UPI00048170F4|nr:FkbM family methyltransferase [Bradyrhizobium japonicum]